MSHAKRGGHTTKKSRPPAYQNRASWRAAEPNLKRSSDEIPIPRNSAARPDSGSPTRAMNPHAAAYAPISRDGWGLSRSAEEFVTPPWEPPSPALPAVSAAFLLPHRFPPPPAGDDWASRALDFESALLPALREAGCENLLRENAVDIDDVLSSYSNEKLWRCAGVLAAAAPRRESGYTRFHRIAMCVADHLEARGVRVV